MKDIKFWLIVGLVAVIALLIIFWPSKPVDQTDNQSFKNTIEKLTLEKAQKDAQISAIFQESEHKDSTVRVELRAKDKEISLLKTKLSKQRPIIQPIIDSIPELKAFIQTQDSIILVTEQKADTLQMALTSQLETIKHLQTLVIDKGKLEAQMFTTCSERVDKLQKSYEKEHKRKNFWKKVGQIAVVVVAVETAIIAIK